MRDILDALGLGKISVGPPYFEVVFPLLMFPAIILMGIGPSVHWGGDETRRILRMAIWPAVASLVAALAAAFAMGRPTVWVCAGLWLAFWVFARTFIQLRARPKGSLAYYGMHLAHAGIGVFIVGITLVKGYELTTDVRMEAGDTVSLGGYSFVLESIGEITGPNYIAARAAVKVTESSGNTFLMHPEKRIYRVQKMPMTEAAIRPRLIGDLYVSLGEALSPTAWVVRVQVKPFVNWIWGGCVFMALGGLLALADRRYRIVARAPEPSPVLAMAAGD